MAMSNADRARSRMTTDESGRTISDADRARARRMTTDESGRTISDADRRRLMAMMLNESGRTMSDQDRRRAEDAYMKRNDGGMAMSGRGKPVRTF